MTKIRWIALALFCTATGLAGNASAQAVTSPEELTAVFAGKTAYITHSNGATQNAYFDTDGTARVTQKAGIKKAGWIIDKGTICHDLSVERKCYTVTKKGADTIQLQSTDRKWTPTYRMVAGNPEKL